MEMIILNMGKINAGMRLTVSLILTSAPNTTPNSYPTISKNSSGGNTYLNIRPYPYFTIDISGTKDKTEGKSPNHTVTLNTLGQLRFTLRLESVIKNLSREDLFSYRLSPNAKNEDDKILTVNKELAKSLRSPFRIGGKICDFEYCVVPDDQGELVYEGVQFIINDNSYYCLLNIEDMHLLLHILKSTNLHQIGLEMLNAYKLNSSDGEMINTIPSLPKIVTEMRDEQTIQAVTTYVPDTNTMPDL